MRTISRRRRRRTDRIKSNTHRNIEGKSCNVSPASTRLSLFSFCLLLPLSHSLPLIFIPSSHNRFLRIRFPFRLSYRSVVKRVTVARSSSTKKEESIYCTATHIRARAQSIAAASFEISKEPPAGSIRERQTETRGLRMSHEQAIERNCHRIYRAVY